MKLTASLPRIVASLLLLGAAFVSSVQAADGNAQVRGVTGRAFYSKDGAQFKPLRVGTKLPAGSVVRTEANSKVDMLIDTDKSVVRVQESSQLGIDTLKVDDAGIEPVVENDLNLPAGEILGNVKKIAAASKYQVKTPNGVAAIRGTEYRVNANGQVTVVSGRVAVTITRTVGNQQVSLTVMVEAGQTFTPPPQTAEGTAQLQRLAASGNGSELISSAPPADIGGIIIAVQDATVTVTVTPPTAPGTGTAAPPTTDTIFVSPITPGSSGGTGTGGSGNPG